MRIGFDGRPLIPPLTGVGVWLKDLLGELARLTPWELALYLPRKTHVELGDLAERVRVMNANPPLLGTLWLATRAAQEVAGSKLFVGTLGVLPRRLEVPSVLVVHDLTPLTRPQHHTLANRFCFNAYLEESLVTATVVVCSSQATAHKLSQMLPGRARDVRVIPLGVGKFWGPGPENVDAVRSRFSEGRPFIVQLGTLEPRKGLGTLIAAHGLLLTMDPTAPDLVLAGAQGWGVAQVFEALHRHPQPHRVHLAGYVTREDARSLLRVAEVVVLASEEEGFGLPLAEALACGAPCVASDAEALVEVGGGAALHFPRRSASELAQTLVWALRKEENAQLRDKALQRGVQLQFDKSCQLWVNLLMELLREAA